ncbi:MAG: hypothetical protein RRY34_05770, partial [Victivallaceae bacterium]
AKDLQVKGKLVMNDESVLELGGNLVLPKVTVISAPDYNVNYGYEFRDNSTIIYNSENDQIILNIDYNNLAVSGKGIKSLEVIKNYRGEVIDQDLLVKGGLQVVGTMQNGEFSFILPGELQVGGSLNLQRSGKFDVAGKLDVTGNVIFDKNSEMILSVGGDFLMGGRFESGLGTIRYIGADQQIIAGSYYNVEFINGSGVSGMVTKQIDSDISAQKISLYENVYLKVRSAAVNESFLVLNQDGTTLGNGVLEITGINHTLVGKSGSIDGYAFKVNGFFQSGVGQVIYSGDVATETQQVANVNYYNLTLLGSSDKLFDQATVSNEMVVGDGDINRLLYTHVIFSDGVRTYDSTNLTGSQINKLTVKAGGSVRLNGVMAADDLRATDLAATNFILERGSEIIYGRL